MIRFFSLLLIFFCTALAAGDKVLIWEATRPGQPGRAYLVGSIHVGKAEWYPLDQAYDRALDVSSEIWFEIYNLNPQEAAQKTMLYGLFRPGTGSLSKVLGFADFQKVCAFYAKHSMLKPEFLDRFRPWLLSMQISQFFLRQHPEYNTSLGFETIFTRYLGKRKAVSLETIDRQFQSMASIPDAASGRLLMDSIREFDQAGRDLDRIERGLASGASHEIAMIANELAFRHREIHRSMFLERNRAMADRIFEALKTEKTVFVLVGAGHFAGKGSILELLLAKGCKLVQQPRTGKPGRIKP